MKKVLCFGDSNTFGFNPENGLKYPQNVRWTGLLKSMCGKDYEIIEAGCNNRTCFRDNFEGKKYTGYKILPEYLKSDLDFVILAVGTNDLQRIYNASLEEIQYGIEDLVSITRSCSPRAKIILITPAEILNTVLKSKIFSFLFDETSIEKSKSMAEIYIKTARKLHCEVVDLTPFNAISEIDGLHYSPEGHRKVAELVCKILC